MDPVLALAIVSFGAFLIVLVTAIIYVFSVRPYLLDSSQLGGSDSTGGDLYDELAGQRAVIEQSYSGLRGTLTAQSETVNSLVRLVGEQGDKLDGIGQRLTRQEGRLDRMADAASARSDEKLTEQARLLAELDRELADQSQVVHKLDGKVNEHTTLLVAAAAERREQSSRLDRILQQLGQVIPLVNKVAPAAEPHHHGEDRLTDIKGIGPVYASRLYEGGVESFRQLASMTPEEILILLNLPEWRKRGANVQGWIEQAQILASQREKVEGAP